jgi:hypothetical protein
MSKKKAPIYCPNCKCNRYTPCYCMRKRGKAKRSVEEIVKAI